MTSFVVMVLQISKGKGGKSPMCRRILLRGWSNVKSTLFEKVFSPMPSLWWLLGVLVSIGKGEWSFRPSDDILLRRSKLLPESA